MSNKAPLIILIALAVVLGVVAVVTRITGDKEAPGSGGEGAAAKKVVYVGFSTSTPYWMTMKKAIDEAAAEWNLNIEDRTPPRADAAEQKNVLDSAIAQGVDGLIIGAVDSKGLNDTVDKAKAKGIFVVAVDTPIDHPDIDAFIGTDNVAASRLAGEYLKARLQPGDKVLFIGGTPGNETGTDRAKGFKEVAEAYGLVLIEDVANWKQDLAYDKTQNYLSANPDIKAIFAACDPMIMGAKQAAIVKNMRDQLILVGFDGNSDCLKAIKAGEVDATVRQFPELMGKQGVEMMYKLLQGETLEQTHVPVEGKLIDKTNIDEYYPG